MAKQFEIKQLDQKRLIKANDLKQITNSALFNSNNGPTADGLLSNEIFGITKEERSGQCAYIDLEEKFIQPYYYKIWLKIDKNLRGCIYETQNFKIDSNGYLIPDDNGQTGIKFLIKNIDKINFKNTKKDQLLAALHDGKKNGLLFTDKFIIIPPFYRDVNTDGGRIGVGEVNKLYVNLMNNVRALSESNDYGLDMGGGTRGRIQDLMLEIYNWFTIGETVAGGEHTGSGIFKKFGAMRRSVMSGTVDNSVRLVISAPNIDVNKREDLMVDLDYSAIPLAAALATMYPFIINYLRSFFSNEFGGKTTYPYIDKNGKLQELTLGNVQLEFSDDRFDKEINEFIHGYSNRLKPIKIPNTEGKDVNLRFKGYNITKEQYASGIRENGNTMERDMTWVDIFYMAACAAAEDKVAIISRYPIDSYFNQLYTKMHISSMNKTEPMVINGVFYQWFTKIRQNDIGSNTANKFIDTLQLCNPYCILMGADYDGDQVTLKVAWTIEANQELLKYMNSNAQFITMAGKNGRLADKEAIQAMYNLTLVLPGTKLTNPVF
jgi:hypothetical protein